MGEVIRSGIELLIRQHPARRDHGDRARRLSGPRAHQVRDTRLPRVEPPRRVPFCHSLPLSICQHTRTLEDTELSPFGEFTSCS